MWKKKHPLLGAKAFSGIAISFLYTSIIIPLFINSLSYPNNTLRSVSYKLFLPQMVYIQINIKCTEKKIIKMKLYL